MKQLEKVECLLAKDETGTNLKELLRYNMSGYDENSLSENAVVQTFQNKISTLGVQKFARCVRQQPRRSNEMDCKCRHNVAFGEPVGLWARCS